MIYLRVIHDVFPLNPRLDEKYPPGIYSFSALVFVPHTMRYKSDLTFREVDGELLVTKNRNEELTQEELIIMVLQSKFVR